MKNFFTIISIIFFSIIALSSLENDAPPINSETKPVLKVSSKTLYKNYSNNEIAADEKYKGKIIQVRGTIRDIGKDIMDEAYISLIGDDFFGDVQCFFPDQSYLLNLKKGQRVNVLGYCDGLFMNIILQNCIIK